MAHFDVRVTQPTELRNKTNLGRQDKRSVVLIWTLNPEPQKGLDLVMYADYLMLQCKLKVDKNSPEGRCEITLASQKWRQWNGNWYISRRPFFFLLGVGSARCMRCKGVCSLLQITYYMCCSSPEYCRPPFDFTDVCMLMAHG